MLALTRCCLSLDTLNPLPAPKSHSLGAGRGVQFLLPGGREKVYIHSLGAGENGENLPLARGRIYIPLPAPRGKSKTHSLGQGEGVRPFPGPGEGIRERDVIPSPCSLSLPQGRKISFPLPAPGEEVQTFPPSP